MTAAEGIGDRLKLAILRAGLHQKQAQELLHARLREGDGVPVKGASHGTFYKILAGRISPRADFLIEAAEVFGVSVTWLLSGSGEMQPREPLGQQDVELSGLQDLPKWIQRDVIGLAEMLFGRTDKRGEGVRDVRRRIYALSEAIAAWLRIPLLHSSKFRRPKSEWEAIQFCEDALRALQLLVPGPGHPPTPGGPDKALAALAEMERGLAGRDEVPKDQEASDDLRQDRGDELRKVEVARLSEDQQRADELSEDHRRKARQDDEVKEQLQEILRLNREGYDARLPDLLRDVIRTLTGWAEVLVAEQGRHALRQRGEPLPTEPGPAVLGDKYTGPLVQEPEEFTPEEKEALAERKRQRKVKQKEVAKRNRQRS